MRAKKPDRNKQYFAKGSTFETRDKVTELARFDWPPMPECYPYPDHDCLRRNIIAAGLKIPVEWLKD